MRLPIGYDDFRTVREQNLDFVDKSLFINNIFDDTSQVVVITRPRRFGKTFNLSMLHYFLAKTAFGKKTSGLFDDLKIAKTKSGYMDHQGKYPVIFLTFKDIKATSYQSAYGDLCKLLSRLYSENHYLLQSEKLTEQQKLVFTSILSESATEFSIKTALFDLTHYLALHHDVNPWVLIDEYDTPIQSAYLHGYYDEMLTLFRNLFGSVLKSNPYLRRGVITGILRISKESLFSGLNNLEVYSLLRSEYSDCFGFTSAEVDSMLAKNGLSEQGEAIRDWYNGYQCGKTIIYNPWSIVNCIKQHGLLQPYWVNTSDNQLVRDLVVQSSGEFKERLECLMRDEPIECLIEENIIFGDLKKNESAVWGLLLMAGYLKVISSIRTQDGLRCKLTIPNREVKNLYQQMIKLWLSPNQSIEWYNNFIGYLLSGNIKAFEKNLIQLMTETVSYHDVGNDQEAFYYGMMLGFTASLYQNKDYELRSNRESGDGRYDYMILSINPEKPTIILEFKRVLKINDEKKLMQNLKKASKKALVQIDKNNYATEAKQRGSKKIIKTGLAFCGKLFKIEEKT